MFDYEREINIYKQMLDDGEITEKKYIEKVTEITKRLRKSDYSKYIFDDEYQYGKSYLKIRYKLIVIVIIILLVMFLFIPMIYKNNLKNSKIYNKNEIGKNTIATLSGVSFNYLDTKVYITYVEKYSITGRIVKTKDYSGINVYNQIVPKDVGISKGILTKNVNNSKIHWSLNNRHLSWYITDGQWINKMGGIYNINGNISNNHLIPKDKEIRKLIDKISENDYVKIDGYLVNIRIEYKDGTVGYANTSLSRHDTGSNACEIIYVTDVIWYGTNY